MNNHEKYKDQTRVEISVEELAQINRLMKEKNIYSKKLETFGRQRHDAGEGPEFREGLWDIIQSWRSRLVFTAARGDVDLAIDTLKAYSREAALALSGKIILARPERNSSPLDRLRKLMADKKLKLGSLVTFAEMRAKANEGPPLPKGWGRGIVASWLNGSKESATPVLLKFTFDTGNAYSLEYYSRLQGRVLLKEKFRGATRIELLQKRMDEKDATPRMLLEFAENRFQRNLGPPIPEGLYAEVADHWLAGRAATASLAHFNFISKMLDVLPSLKPGLSKPPVQKSTHPQPL